MIRLPKIDHKEFLTERKIREIGLRPEFPGTPELLRFSLLTSAAPPYYKIDEDQLASVMESGELPEAGFTAASIEIGKYQTHLDTLTEDELLDLYRDELEKKNAEDDKARFFNKPAAKADFDYWSKMAIWTLDEAVSLAFGKSPAVVNRPSLARESITSSPFVREYLKTVEVIKRAEMIKALINPVPPLVFARWARKTGIPFPDELFEKVEAQSGEPADWKTLYDELLDTHNELVENTSKIIAEKCQEIEDLKSQAKDDKPLHPKERVSLLKLVIGMAVTGYGYQLDVERSPKIKEISDDLDLIGISLDVDTVRKWLTEGKELLPRSKAD